MELWDIVDLEGRPTGRTMVRGTPISPGDYHLAVHVWIRDRTGRWLIQRRSEDVDCAPGIWAATGGSVLAGEGSLAAAIRETREELGIRLEPSYFKTVLRIVGSDYLTDLWIAEVDDVDPTEIVCNKEVAEAKWVAEEEIRGMLSAGTFWDHGPEYFAALGLVWQRAPYEPNSS